MQRATSRPSGLRRAWCALIFATVAAGAGLAEEEVSGADFLLDNGFIRSWADPFTDDYKGTILLLTGDGDTAFRTYHYTPDVLDIQFYGAGPEQEIDDGTLLNVVWRIDDFAALTWNARWSSDDGNASTRVTAEAAETIAGRLAEAKRVIYRIGDDGDVQRIHIPYEMPELIAEFRRRVVASRTPR